MYVRIAAGFPAITGAASNLFNVSSFLNYLAFKQNKAAY